MKKEFKLSFGDAQELPFFDVEINEDGTALDPSMTDKLFAFENDATIVDISHLEYVPVSQSVYNAEEKEFPDSDKSTAKPLGSNMKAYAYLVNNVLYGKLYIRPGSAKMNELIEALSKDPKIIPVD
jgi:hypothetical protein